jgi:hypothetical protein
MKRALWLSLLLLALLATARCEDDYEDEDAGAAASGDEK